MTRARFEEAALRRQALTTRAALQRVQVEATLARLHAAVATPKGIGGLALRLASSWMGSQTGRTTPGSGARPWMLSAGWLLVRALRSSPTARWVVGAGAAGAAIWWVVQALRTSDVDDGSG